MSGGVRERRPREGIQPCWSGLQVQGTASSPPSTARVSLRGPTSAGRGRGRDGGGEGGIRTLDGLPRTAFPVRRHSPLGDLSAELRAARAGAEPRTQGWAARRVRAGGEGGIRTHAAFADRFSRAAPSTTRTPLRRGG